MAEDGNNTQSKLMGVRTYLMGAGIIVHQIAKQVFEVDLPDSLWSSLIDVALGIGVVYYRYKANHTVLVKAEKKLVAKVVEKVEEKVDEKISGKVEEIKKEEEI